MGAEMSDENGGTAHNQDSDDTIDRSKPPTFRQVLGESHKMNRVDDASLALHQQIVQADGSKKEQQLDFYDARWCPTREHPVGEVVLELFWAAEMKNVVDEAAFKREVRELLARKGLDPITPFPLRQGGCMISLTACPVVLSEADAWKMGAAIFVGFPSQEKPEWPEQQPYPDQPKAGATSAHGTPNPHMKPAQHNQ